jgi:hypothetical protein
MPRGRRAEGMRRVTRVRLNSDGRRSRHPAPNLAVGNDVEATDLGAAAASLRGLQCRATRAPVQLPGELLLGRHGALDREGLGL